MARNDDRAPLLAELTLSERRLSAAVDLAGLGLWELDPVNDVRWYSPELLAMLGLDRSHENRDAFLAAVHPDDRALINAATTAALDKGTPYHLTMRIRRSDGEWRWFETRAHTAENAAGQRRIYGVVQDITARKQAESQLVTADRMASLGILSAGVAHEINNPLTALLTSLSMVRRSAQGGDPRAQRLLDDAVAAAERIRGIAADLCVFARDREEDQGPADIHRVIDSTVRMARNEIRHRALLVEDLAPVPRVAASESRLGQVFLNLLVNAAQAIEGGHAADNEIRVATSVDAHGWVVVEVADTGGGIAPEIRDRLFSPFVTTKPAGVGTGLGLAICHRIVTGMGGAIEVDSAPGSGTRFLVRLPPASGGGGGRADSHSEVPAAARRGRILIVDDEPMVAAIVGELLSEEHEVVVDNCGRSALARFAAGERFDVILCDLMMPDLPGSELHQAIHAAAPDQARRIVFMTGGAFTEQSRDFLTRVSNPRIDKPFDGDRLRRLVNRMVAV